MGLMIRDKSIHPVRGRKRMPARIVAAKLPRKSPGLTPLSSVLVFRRAKALRSHQKIKAEDF